MALGGANGDGTDWFRYSNVWKDYKISDCKGHLGSIKWWCKSKDLVACFKPSASECPKSNQNESEAARKKKEADARKAREAATRKKEREAERKLKRPNRCWTQVPDACKTKFKLRRSEAIRNGKPALEQVWRGNWFRFYQKKPTDSYCKSAMEGVKQFCRTNNVNYCFKPKASDCGPYQQPAGRCGPLFRNTSCTAKGNYCNEANGWCGSGAAWRDAQKSTKFDYKAKVTPKKPITKDPTKDNLAKAHLAKLKKRMMVTRKTWEQHRDA